MAIHPSLSLRAARRNTLAACLAAALAAGGAVAGSTPRSADAPRAYVSSDEAIFGALHTTRVSGTKNGMRDIGVSPLPVPMHPAEEITVTNCLDDGSDGSLRWAFANAIDGSVIDFALACSSITLASGAIVVETPNLTLIGPGQDRLTIDGGDADRVFAVPKYSLDISDLTIANGNIDSGMGGCINLVTGDLTLTRTKVTGCSAGDGSNAESFGGAVYVAGDLIMQSSTISVSSSMASSRSDGGAAYVVGDAHLDNSTIEGNTATATSDSARGGGLFVKGTAYVDGSRVMDNEANSTDGDALGGGIYSAYRTRTYFSTISGNTAHSDNGGSFAGGIHSGSSVRLAMSTLSGNTAGSDCETCGSSGGGASAFGSIYATHSTIRDNQALVASDSEGIAIGGGLVTFALGIYGEIALTNSTVSGNSARGGENGGAGYGGGIAANSGPFLAINSTIAFNTASHFGGGAIGSDAAGASALHSSIVANNQAPEGADLARSSPFNSFTVGGSNNLVLEAGAGITLPGDTITLDPHLLTLTDENGGPMATHALATDSPAVDRGINANNLPYDQRGCPHPRESGVAVDIGAFELQTEIIDHIFRHGFDGVAALCP